MELEKLHQIASPMALLRHPTPPSRLFSPILLPRLLPTVDCCIVVVFLIVITVVVVLVIFALSSLSLRTQQRPHHPSNSQKHSSSWPFLHSLMANWWNSTKLSHHDIAHDIWMGLAQPAATNRGR